MKAVQNILSAISALLAAIALIYGFWLFGSAGGADAGSPARFTLLLAAACVSVVATTVVTLVRNKTY
jgi:hypothetical protein